MVEMPIITISRGTFSGGKDLAECLAEKLGYRCISREVLTEAASRYGIREEDLTRALTEKPGFLKRVTLERIHYLACIRAALCQQIKNNNIVYHGHAGHFLLKGVPNVLRVRVVAGMEYRIKAAMERNKLNKEEAVRYIKKMDDERLRWTEFLYHVDWRDPALYDLVINLDRVSIPSACELIRDAITLEEFRAIPDWEKIWNDLALSCSARAKIAVDKNIGTRDRGIELEANDGVVTIGGKVDSHYDAERLEEMIRQMPDVRDVVIKVEYFSHEDQIL